MLSQTEIGLLKWLQGLALAADNILAYFWVQDLPGNNVVSEVLYRFLKDSLQNNRVTILMWDTRRFSAYIEHIGLPPVDRLHDFSVSNLYLHNCINHTVFSWLRWQVCKLCRSFQVCYTSWPPVRAGSFLAGFVMDILERDIADCFCKEKVRVRLSCMCLAWQQEHFNLALLQAIAKEFCGPEGEERSLVNAVQRLGLKRKQLPFVGDEQMLCCLQEASDLVTNTDTAIAMLKHQELDKVSYSLGLVFCI